MTGGWSLLSALVNVRAVACGKDDDAFIGFIQHIDKAVIADTEAVQPIEFSGKRFRGIFFGMHGVPSELGGDALK